MKRYRKSLTKYRNATNINAQNIIDEWANKFDQKFYDGKLLKSGSINLTLRDDLDYLRACPEYSNGLTYSYPTQQRWKYMKRGFSCFITHSLSKAENRETLIDNAIIKKVYGLLYRKKSKTPLISVIFYSSIFYSTHFTKQTYK